MPQNQDDPDHPAKQFSAFGHTIETARPAPGLYIVATPIGNLGDVTIRALEILAGVDRIACEDTRVTRRLLERYGISTPLLSYHDRNGATQRPRLLANLAGGEAIALVSDAGTPLVSDPGYKLVRDAKEAGIEVFAIPGASSVMAGLVVAGLPTDRFYFEGFLPSRQQARLARIRELAGIDATLVFFESAKRVIKTLADLHAEFGDRDAVVAREITKKFEETIRGSLGELASGIGETTTLKGEIVLLVGPPNGNAGDGPSLDDALRDTLKTLSVREASTEIASLLNMPRRKVYGRALELAGKGRGKDGKA